jgi:hypothetical protein
VTAREEVNDDVSETFDHVTSLHSLVPHGRSHVWWLSPPSFSGFTTTRASSLAQRRVRLGFSAEGQDGLSCRGIFENKMVYNKYMLPTLVVFRPSHLCHLRNLLPRARPPSHESVLSVECWGILHLPRPESPP